MVIPSTRFHYFLFYIFFLEDGCIMYVVQLIALWSRAEHLFNYIGAYSEEKQNLEIF